ncbi:cysteine-rich venom protein-like isoform X2 [Pleurodeles waltl]|uniref:cysteine-rich venom protein-like isoform X2 n=1 Tax=Pleurodeles waltl TaxID=8319 RepID=UPI00370967A6
MTSRGVRRRKESKRIIFWAHLTGLTMLKLLPSFFALLHLTVEAYDLRNCSTITTNLPEVQEEIVTTHNYFRKLADPPAANMLKMHWDDGLAARAQVYADTCICNHSLPSFRAANGYPCGENILLSPYCMSWTNVLEVWKNESQIFTFGYGPKAEGLVFGHYTQIVSFNSHKVGCGMAVCPNSTCGVFYVCHYYFAGNREKTLYTPYTPGERCSLCKNDCEDGLCTNPCKYEDQVGNCKEAKERGLCQTFIKRCMVTCDMCEGKIH